MKEKVFIATFGRGHEHHGKVQPIVAYNKEHAKRKMFEVYGKEWAFVYDEEIFKKSVYKGSFESNTELRTLYALHKVTFGEMKKLTDRFNQIIGGAQCLMEKRLRQMQDDIKELAKQDDFVLQMWMAIELFIDEKCHSKVMN